MGGQISAQLLHPSHRRGVKIYHQRHLDGSLPRLRITDRLSLVSLQRQHQLVYLARIVMLHRTLPRRHETIFGSRGTMATAVESQHKMSAHLEHITIAPAIGHRQAVLATSCRAPATNGPISEAP